MRIRELANRSGVPARTVRYYADQRLISPAGRSDGGIGCSTSRRCARSAS